MTRTPPPSAPLTGMLLLAIVSLAGGLAFVVFAQRAIEKKPDSCDVIQSKDTIRVAFLGNSILYYNDCPRLVEHMLKTRFSEVVQDSCLRGGASLVSLWEKGNGMGEKFAVPAAKREDGTFDVGAPSAESLIGSGNEWDFVIMNDYTQAPARVASKQATLDILEKTYSTLLHELSATPVFLQTAAYRLPGIKKSHDLGSFEDFTRKIAAGYHEYVERMSSIGIPARLAPSGNAFAHVHATNRDLWEKLYSHDDFHPSPSGTWLEACVLYCTIAKEEPPIYDERWWETSRYFASPPIPFPTAQEAEELRKAACHVCQIPI